ncbi:MAG TPA: penicillin-binding transpeptidase domain-containing protein [Anaerolineaceae bacterium]|nr:penicillin-binding transpeptidase domain-containing protein [Anaerolineaceae bacterium]
MKRIGSIILLFVILVSACTPTSNVTVTETVPAATATLPEPQISTTRSPDVKEIAQTYLNFWAEEDYESMYAMLSRLSQEAFPIDAFTKRYQDAVNTMSLVELTSEVTSSLTNPRNAQVGYSVNFLTALVGTISRDMVMNLTMEEDTWKVQWEEGLILPELTGGNYLSMDISAPARGNIYDRNGEALVAQSEVVALGITPGGIGDNQHGALVSYLSQLTGLNGDYIRSKYEFAGPDWYIPIGETARSNVDRYYSTLSTIGGLNMNYYTSRYYFDGGVAAHITGYVQPIFPEELAEYKRNGYRGDEKVGRTGLEAWGEDVLIGKRGASLYVIRPDGTVETRIGYADSQLSQSIYTTIAQDFQAEVELAINGFRGAVVVLERDTGRVLAMASSPTYDPNLFDPNNFNSSWMLGDMLNPAENRLLNRAAQSSYPLGSVFKIITLAAALETETFKADDMYYCGHSYTDLEGVTLYDWTLEKELPPSGDLTLSEGLMRSCNPWFYHIGLTMWNRGLTNGIADMARGFGLGSPTGIEQIQEVAGNIPDTMTPGDSVQIAIGQSSMLTTPLQVATFIAAIGNGGTLYKPQLVESIAPADGDATFEFEPIETGTLPISEENLIIIQDAMRSVVANARGTARNPMLGLQIPIYGKTGTAQNPPLQPHAWFAGYTDLGDPDRPDIAVVVLAENAGEGSEIAAPIFRRVIELYFFNRIQRLYPWESTFYVTRTPTSQYTNTPVPQPTEEPQEEETVTEETPEP